MHKAGTKIVVKMMLVALFAISVSATLFSISFAVSQEATLESKWIQGPVPIIDPNSPLWKQARAVEVPLSPQVTAAPMLMAPSIRSLTFRSLNNGSWAVFLLEWKDNTKNMSTLKITEFRDAVAMQFPLSSEQPYICMGQLGNTVTILHWKADWQQDMETYYHDVKDAFPNLYVDYYPFAVGKPPYATMPVANISRPYVTGLAAGNPFSNPLRLTPVEETISGGFGTLTSQTQQDTTGRGMWEGGAWRTVLARPMTTADPNDAVLAPGKTKPVAFAVWDGGNREVGGKKSVSSWLVLSFEGPKGVRGEFAPSVWQLSVIGGVWALSIALILFIGRSWMPRRGSK